MTVDPPRSPAIIAVAILIGSALIALAILFTNHWQLSSGGQVILRMNRWSGGVSQCGGRIGDVIVCNRQIH